MSYSTHGKKRKMKKDELRPETLEDYVGQDHIKDLLWTSIEAAKIRDQQLDHVLLNGPPGLGKTTLALIIARQMGWKIKTVIGPTVGSPKNISKLIMGLEDKSILFIDEIHRVNRPTQETIYPVLEDNKLQSYLSTDVEIPIPPITIIGATTNIGKLEQPFIDRFGLYFQLEYYSNTELGEIVFASAEKLQFPIGHDGVDEITKRARGTPRIANNFLKRLRDYCLVDGAEPTGKFTADIIWKYLHTDEHGLRPLDRRYLKALDGKEAGLGLEALATIVREEPDTIEGFVEPYLVNLGLVERRRNGRWLTENGKNFVQKMRSPG